MITNHGFPPSRNTPSHRRDYYWQREKTSKIILKKSNSYLETYIVSREVAYLCSKNEKTLKKSKTKF